MSKRYVLEILKDNNGKMPLEEVYNILERNGYSRREIDKTLRILQGPERKIKILKKENNIYIELTPIGEIIAKISE